MKFDRVVCVSLDRRPDRRAAFLERLPVDFPWGEVEIYSAIDGKKCKHPEWWTQGGGAWGCYRSHLDILEQSLMAGHQRILIFEDDATFCERFSHKALEFFARLPRGWEQAYLGGQHLRRPKEIEEHWVRAINVNRTHAYAVQGAGITKLYRWLHQTHGWQPRHHVDHHYGRLHSTRGIEVYAPRVWLCGQAADEKSDVCWKPVNERWWMMRQPGEEVEQKPFVVVLGLHRSGSSATAMILHKLGVSMGDKLQGYEGRNGGGGEAVGLTRICERASPFPHPGVKHPGRLERTLREWLNGRRRRSGNVTIGCKYPTLCAAGEILKDTLGDQLRVVHCDRPLEDSVESLQRRHHNARGAWSRIPDEDLERVQQWLWGRKQEFLADIPEDRVHTVKFNDLHDDTAGVVDGLISFLNLAPTPQQRQAAIDHIRETRRQ